MSKAKDFLKLVVIEHSVFALPFAYLAAFTAMSYTYTKPFTFGFSSKSPGESFVKLSDIPRHDLPHTHIEWMNLLLVTIAMVSARTVAMAANRIVDRELDARNPRTANRELVTGAIAVKTATTGLVVALVIFLLTALALNPLCLALSIPAVIPLIVYPYAKRFTNFPQVFLGIAQMVAPVGAYIAITGHWSGKAVILGVAVGTWIGGFDLVYACQDVESDRAEGVGSVPARYGKVVALRAARVVHVITFVLFARFGIAEHFGPTWYVGLALTAIAFIYQHSIVSAEDLSRANRSFFTTNGVIAIGLFAFGTADLFVHGGLRL